jgi:DNA-binding transcriptional LysR family regulator
MQLKHLKSFLAVAATLNFRQAARQVGVTQPAVSQHIAQLERELGVKLFDRTRHWVSLTTAGEALRGGATEGLATIDRSIDLARKMGGLREKTVIVGQLDYISHAFLPQAITAVKKRMPEVLVELINLPPKEAVQAARDGRVDVGFGLGTIDEPDLVHREVVRGRWVVWMPEAHPLTRLEAVPMAELARHPIIIFQRSINPLAYDALMARFAKAGAPLTVAHHVSQPQHGLPLVLQGVGVYLVGSYVFTERARGVVSRPITGFDTELKISAVWRAGHRTPALKTFLDGLPRKREFKG